jgi:twitching motility protein PilT
MPHFERVLTLMIERNASDLHLKVNCPPVCRINGELITFPEFGNYTGEDLQRIAYAIMSPKQKELFQATSELDFAYSVPDLGRFRTNIFLQRGTFGIIMRLVKTQIPTFQTLHLPPMLTGIAEAKSGIIAVSGPTGCGKSSTLAAIVDYINSREKVHIMAVEDPIEYLHADKMGIVNQREVGIDTESFKNALKYIMRQDPDVILIGEMRDSETLMAAMMAAEIGHLVLTTLHTVSASSSVLRMLDFFPSDMRDQVRAQLASVLNAVVCQRLIQTDSGKGVVPAVEIMVCTGMVRKLMYENKFDKLSAAIELGKEFGMQTFNQSLLQLVQAGTISTETALANSLHPESLKLNLQGIYLDDSRRILDT